MDIKIIFEDENLLILNKPPHLVVFPTVHYPKLEQTLAGFVNHYLGNAISHVGKVNRFGFVHRLDRDTSGVIVVAKNQKIWDFLLEKFSHHEIKKEYLALVWGDFAPVTDKDSLLNVKLAGEWWECTSAIDRNPKDTKQFIVSKTGGQAVTRFKKEKVFRFESSAKRQETMTLVRVAPLSGRTHQIRVHLKALGYPIVGDWLYGGRKHYRWVKEKLDRQFLHARFLNLTMPSGKKMTFESPLAADLENFLSFLKPI